MARAAAAEIEKRERPVIETPREKMPHVAKDFVMMHVVVIQHLIVDRPLVEEIVRRVIHSTPSKDKKNQVSRKACPELSRTGRKGFSNPPLPPLSKGDERGISGFLC